MGKASLKLSRSERRQSGEKLGLTFSKPGGEEKGTSCKTGLFPGSRDAAVNTRHLYIARNLLRNDPSRPISVLFSMSVQAGLLPVKAEQIKGIVDRVSGDILVR